MEVYSVILCYNSAGWVAQGDYIASMPTNCAASLLFSANLVKPGQVRFEYAYSDENAVFHFLVSITQYGEKMNPSLSSGLI